MTTEPSTKSIKKSLLQRVRIGEIRQPQQNGFSVDLWLKALLEFDEPSGEDIQLFLSALWFDRQLTALRDLLNKIDIEDVPKALRIRCMIAIANREHVVISQKLQSRIAREKRRIDAFPIDKMRGSRLESSVTNETFTADEISTTGIDLLSYPLDQAINMKSVRAKKTIDSKEQFSRIIKANEIANVYHVLVDYWLSCLWLGWRLKSNDNIDYFIPQNVKEAKQYAASEYRQENWAFSDAYTAAKIWSELEEGERKALNYQMKIPNIRLKNNKREYSIRELDVDPKKPPYSFMMMTNFPDGIAEELVDRPFPSKPSLTINALLNAWQVMHSLVKQSLNLNADTGVHNIEALRRFEIVIKQPELQSIFSRCFNNDNKLAKDLVEFFTYKSRSQHIGGLWSRPLIACGYDNIAIVAAPLLIGNPQRSVEFWLRLGEVDMAERGAAFETSVRESVATSLQKSKILKDADVLMRNLEIGTEKEEIDLIFRIGKTILVVEVKCHVYPSDPIEVHNFVNGVLDEAVIQAKRKSDVVRNEKKLLETLFGISLGKEKLVKVVPLVITNLALGAGNARSDVPILDMRFITQYLEYGYFEFKTTTTGVSSLNSKQVEYLYRNEKEAEQHCFEHFLNQPILEKFSAGLVMRQRPIPNLDGKPTWWVYYEVDGEVLHEQAFSPSD